MQLELFDYQEITKEELEEYELEKQKQREEFKDLLKDYKARHWIWRLLAFCGVFNTMSHTDPHMMSILSGKRDVGLWILAEVFEADEKAFVKMQREAKEREENE